MSDHFAECAREDALAATSAGDERSLPPWRNLVRFAIVGLLQNAASFIAVLLAARLGLAPWGAFAIVFPLAAIGTYWFNSRWTFGERRKRKIAPLAYALVYVSAYVLTLVASYALATAGVPSVWNVLLTIGGIGLYTFVLLNRGVFR